MIKLIYYKWYVRLSFIKQIIRLTINQRQDLWYCIVIVKICRKVYEHFSSSPILFHKEKEKKGILCSRHLEETKILALSLGSRSKVVRSRTHLLASQVLNISVSSFCHRKAVRHRQFLIVSVIFHKTSRKRADVHRPFSPLLPASVGNRRAPFFLACSLSFSRWFRGLLKMIAIRDKYEGENFSRHPREISSRPFFFFFSRRANFSDQSADKACRGKRKSHGAVISGENRLKIKKGCERTLRRAIWRSRNCTTLGIVLRWSLIVQLVTRIARRACAIFITVRKHVS